MPIKKQTLDEQMTAQGLTLGAGETAITYRDIAIMRNAVTALAQRVVRKEARMFLVRAARELKGHTDDYADERSRIQRAHLPADVESMAPDEPVQFSNPAVMALALASLDAMLAPVKLPGVLSDDMLPVADKAHPTNADGLTAILADLLYLYPLPDETDDAKVEAA